MTELYVPRVGERVRIIERYFGIGPLKLGQEVIARAGTTQSVHNPGWVKLLFGDPLDVALVRVQLVDAPEKPPVVTEWFGFKRGQAVQFKPGARLEGVMLFVVCPRIDISYRGGALWLCAEPDLNDCTCWGYVDELVRLADGDYGSAYLTLNGGSPPLPASEPCSTCGLLEHSQLCRKCVVCLKRFEHSDKDRLTCSSDCESMRQHLATLEARGELHPRPTPVHLTTEYQAARALAYQPPLNVVTEAKCAALDQHIGKKPLRYYGR